MERLNRSIQTASSSEQYARQLTEHKIQNERIDEKRRHLNQLYDQLDQGTRTRYSKQHYDLEKRSNELQDKIIQQIIRSEHLLRMWKEYEMRLEDVRHQTNEMQNQLKSTQRLWTFEQIQSAFTLYKVRRTYVSLRIVHMFCVI